MSNNKKQTGISRRKVIGQAAGVAALATGLGSRSFAVHLGIEPRAKQAGANDKLVLGLIGCAGMGAANMRTLMGFNDVEVAAICDVDDNRMPGDFNEINKKYGKRPSVYRDYRQMLERKDIDAVIIGSPDHWHALHLIHACEAGKDSYCEKPISHNVVEAVAMARCVEKHKRVVQVGTWQRSTREFTDAIDTIRSGKLGKIVHCRAWITDGFRAGNQQVAEVPSSLDYDFWTGPAEMIPYKANHVHYNWRWFSNTGGGMTTDWGVHMIDIALLGMSQDQDLVMPEEITTWGGQWAYVGDDRTAPDTIETLYKFRDPDFVLTWSVLRDHPGKPGHCTEFISAEGKTLRVWRGGWTLLDPDGKELPKESTTSPGSHWREWVDCVKSRGKPSADLGSVAQTTIVCHLSNVALQVGQPVRWNKAKMDLEGKAGRDTLAYSRPYRKPWVLPKY